MIAREPQVEKETQIAVTQRLAHRWSGLLTLVWIMAASCGTETGNPGDLDPDGSNRSLTEEQTIASVEVSSHITEIAEVTSEWSQSAALTAPLAGGTSSDQFALTADHAEQPVSLTLKRQAVGSGPRLRTMTEPQSDQRLLSGALEPTECQEVDNTAVVNQTRDIDVLRSVVYREEPMQLRVSGSVSNVHTYSRRDNEPVVCGAGGLLPLLKREDYSQLTIASVIDTNKKQILLDSAGQTTLRTLEQSRKGTRTVSFSIDNDGDGGIQITRAATGSMTQTSTLTTTKATKELSSSYTIPDDAPLLVRTTRTSLGVWTQKIVESGTLVSITKEGYRVTTTVSALTFERTKGCAPSSGSVSGVVTPPEGSAVKEATYAVVYTEGSAYITFDNGETFEELPVDTCAE
jgi:hypothetical protein